MPGVYVVYPGGETAGPVPWPQISPRHVVEILEGKIPIIIRPVGPGPLIPEAFVNEMNAARDTYLKTVQDIGERLDSQLGGEGITIQTIP